MASSSSELDFRTAVLGKRSEKERRWCKSSLSSQDSVESRRRLPPPLPSQLGSLPCSEPWSPPPRLVVVPRVKKEIHTEAAGKSVLFLDGGLPQEWHTPQSILVVQPAPTHQVTPATWAGTRNDYKDYAEVCFKEFGDRVKHWITFNEPWTFCSNGYASGLFAPGRCSPWEKGNCSVGDSGREPYTACHHQLLAHAETVRLYKEKYQAVQRGKIGITLVSHWFVPFSRSKSNDDAARRAIDFMFGWFMDPLVRGEYPLSMRGLVGNRLPQFTKEQSELVKGAFDFIGLNYYTANYADNLPPSNGLNTSYNTDSRANLTGVRNGVPIGPQAASPWLYIYPPGFRELLLYVKETYGNPTVYITENGVDEANNKSLPLQEALKDDTRIEYYHTHLLSLLSAIRDGANVKGYFAWSLLDNFEWGNGYTVRFGINFVDYNDGLKRYPKNSAHWFKKFLQK